MIKNKMGIEATYTRFCVLVCYSGLLVCSMYNQTNLYVMEVVLPDQQTQPVIDPEPRKLHWQL